MWHTAPVPMDEPCFEALSDELKLLHDRLISRAFRWLYGKRPLAIPHLRHFARILRPGDWCVDHVDALLQVIKTAANANELSEKPIRDSTDMTWTELAYIIFNLNNENLDHIDQKQYDYLLDIAMQRSNLDLSKRTWSNIVDKLCKKLAVELDKMGDNADLLQRVKQVSPELEDGFVRRPRYEAWFVERSPQAIFVLHGDAGTGKTELAKRLARLRNPDEHVWVLRASDKNAFNNDMADFVAACGVEPRDINATNVRVHFALLLSADPHPAVVVIDDVRDYSLVTFVPKNPRTTVIMTSMYEPPTSLGEFSVKVFDLAESEAAAMVRLRYTVGDPAEVQKLANALGNRALAIDHACGFLTETGMQPAQLLPQLAKQPAETLKIIADPTDPHGKVLTNIYELVLAELSRFPETLAVLDTFLFLDPYVVREEHIAMTWKSNVVVDPDAVGMYVEVDGKTQYAEHVPTENLMIAPYAGVAVWKRFPLLHATDGSRLTVAGALRHLRCFNLIHYDDTGRPSMHTLTRRLLQDLRIGERSAVRASVWTTMYKMLAVENWEGGQILRGECMEMALHSANFLADDELKMNIDRNDTLSAQIIIWNYAAALRACRQEISEKYEPVFNKARSGFTYRALQLVKEDSEFADRTHLPYALNSLIAECHEVLVLCQYPQSHPLESLWVGHGLTDNELGVRSGSIVETYIRNDTEWEPLGNIVDQDALLLRATRDASLLGSRIGAVSYRDLHSIAGSAVAASCVFFQQACWNDAVAALEHAAACYEKIGGHADSIRGFVEASWRLARVHLRAGDITRSKEWSGRAYGFIKNRTYVSARGRHRFGFKDTILQMRLLQQQAEQRLTEWCLDESVEPTIEHPHGDSMIRYALEMWSGASSMGLSRLLPELGAYILRVRTCAPQIINSIHIPGLVDYMRSRGGVFQRALLEHHLGVGQLFMMTALVTDRDLFRETLLLRSEDVNAVDGLERRLKDGQKNFEKNISQHIEIFEQYKAPYWRARGLAVLPYYGIISDKSDAWLERAYNEFCVAANDVHRPDWIKWMDEGGLPLWLLSC